MSKLDRRLRTGHAAPSPILKLFIKTTHNTSQKKKGNQRTAEEASGVAQSHKLYF